MLENIFLIILIIILAFFFLFFLFWFFFIRREFQFLKDHIKIRKEIENIQEIEEAKNNIVNLALSKKAVHFTRCVNRFLGFFGLSIDKLHNFNKALRFKDSSNYIKKYYNIILNVLTWKNLIRFLDAKFFKYEKYQLNTNEFINQQIIRLQNE